MEKGWEKARTVGEEAFEKSKNKINEVRSSQQFIDTKEKVKSGFGSFMSFVKSTASKAKDFTTEQ